MKRSIERYKQCSPQAMAKHSPSPVFFAFCDMKDDILELHQKNEELKKFLASIAETLNNRLAVVDSESMAKKPFCDFESRVIIGSLANIITSVLSNEEK